MATFAEIYDLRYANEDLLKRVTSAVAKVAYYIISTEPVETTGHAARLVWAKDALVNTPAAAQKMMWCIAQNATINNNPVSATDNDIEYVVNVSATIFGQSM